VIPQRPDLSGEWKLNARAVRASMMPVWENSDSWLREGGRRMSFNLLLGIAALAYGLYTGYARTASPEKFGKLQAMKKQWGESTGNIVHLVAYTVVPIVVGLALIATSLRTAAPR
jgi:hypothetical protein